VSRGFKRSIPLKKEAGFVDKRSWRSIDGHDLLRGADKSARRTEIAQRDNFICQICGDDAFPRADRGDGEWRHLANEHNGFKRCDCMEGGEWAHHACHFAADHPGVQWTKKIPQQAE
jgi:hypothetical protein